MSQTGERRDLAPCRTVARHEIASSLAGRAHALAPKRLVTLGSRLAGAAAMRHLQSLEYSEYGNTERARASEARNYFAASTRP